ncbi:hypothetical protein P43SY_003324 [Pythium insidiosum]|uniref:F-box domain-containing protein n=1 Tax=Pythium insidiosum TaxID=114742 RepID=A0AAD5M6R1_PYTIN|nr:hypothetical protein P43SY_003324 [Pythium insidiosum]
MRAHVWRDHVVSRHLLTFLSAADVGRLARVDRQSRRAVTRALRDFRQRSARLSLSLWVLRHLECDVQSFYQELQTHTVPRSETGDARVPPRVVSVWAERGVVPAIRFSSDEAPAVLANVERQGHRIYSVLTLRLRLPPRDGHQDARVIPLRTMTYLPASHEWRARLSAAEKTRLQRHGAMCRFDLISADGSIALELALPPRTDALLDYYLIQRVVAVVSIQELLERASVLPLLLSTVSIEKSGTFYSLVLGSLTGKVLVQELAKRTMMQKNFKSWIVENRNVKYMHNMKY